MAVNTAQGQNYPEGTMPAAVIREAGKLALERCEIPTLQHGQALIRVKYAGICGTDIHVLNGHHSTATFPVIPGHEFVGELVDFIGECSLNRGDMVVAQPVFSCGHCEPCSKGQDNVCRSLKIHGVHVDGGFAWYVKAPIRKVYKLSDSIDLQVACLTEPLAVAVHDVRRSGIQVGNNALVIGGGPIGLLIAIVARHAGVSGVVISEISEYRRKMAEELGFVAINPLDSDFDEHLTKLSGGSGFDVVYEVSGSKPAIKTAVDAVKITGTVMIIGMTQEDYPVSLSKIFQKELTLRGVRIHAQVNFIGAIELLNTGTLDVYLRKLVSKIYPLERVEEAFAAAQSGDANFKILVEMD